MYINLCVCVGIFQKVVKTIQNKIMRQQLREYNVSSDSTHLVSS